MMPREVFNWGRDVISSDQRVGRGGGEGKGKGCKGVRQRSIALWIAWLARVWAGSSRGEGST